MNFMLENAANLQRKNFPVWFSLQIIVFYRSCLSPYLGRHCRFFPSCSLYAAQALIQKGWLAGMGLSFIRILKCHPFHPGGIDPVE